MLWALSLGEVACWRGYTLYRCGDCQRPSVAEVFESRRVVRWWNWVLWESERATSHELACPHCRRSTTTVGPAEDYHFSDDPHVLMELCRPRYLARLVRVSRYG
jgi:DNA-directed RNA polymerase subunit RPC12/RpoP